MLVTLAALAALASGADCGLKNLAACPHTNLLFWDRAFQRAVTAFVGHGRANYSYSGDRAEQQLNVLGGAPDDPVRIGELYRFTACRPHSCDEKGAVVLEPSGKIVATAILYFNCGGSGRSCAKQPTFTLFVRDPSRAKPVADNLTAWAKAAADDMYVGENMPARHLDHVEVFSVSTGVPKPVKLNQIGPR